MVMPWLPWVILAVAAVVVGAAAVRGGRSRTGRAGGRARSGGRWSRWRRARRAASEPSLIANSAPLLAHPQVRRRIRDRRLALACLALLGVLGLASASLIAARPVDISERNEALSNRDIVLCLDVSTSMVTTDARILETFSTLLDSFDGERVALVVWNTTAQTIVPLTDDYDLLRNQINEVAEVLDFIPYYGNPAMDDYNRTFAGTFGAYDIVGTSLVGDGLASCSLSFDRQVEDRSRSIILATDNLVQDLFDEQIYSLTEAADLATEEKVRLISIYGTDPELSDPMLSGDDPARARAELEEVTTSHNGLFYEVDDPDAADDIVRELEKDQAEEVAGDTTVRVTDTPEGPVLSLTVGVVALLLIAAWRRA